MYLTTIHTERERERERERKRSFIGRPLLRLVYIQQPFPILFNDNATPSFHMASIIEIGGCGTSTTQSRLQRLLFPMSPSHTHTHTHTCEHATLPLLLGGVLPSCATPYKPQRTAVDNSCDEITSGPGSNQVTMLFWHTCLYYRNKSSHRYRLCHPQTKQTTMFQGDSGVLSCVSEYGISSLNFDKKCY